MVNINVTHPYKLEIKGEIHNRGDNQSWDIDLSTFSQLELGILLKDIEISIFNAILKREERIARENELREKAEYLRLKTIYEPDKLKL